MLKYESTLVTFTEVPDEISLCFNLTLCPCHCQGCFEPWLAEDSGTILTITEIEKWLLKKPHCTCICFMGGDNDHESLVQLCREIRQLWPHLKLAMYSGCHKWDEKVAQVLDYYKVGPYIPQAGPLNKSTTNQRFFKKEGNENWQDITYRFQEKKE